MLVLKALVPAIVLGASWYFAVRRAGEERALPWAAAFVALAGIAVSHAWWLVSPSGSADWPMGGVIFASCWISDRILAASHASWSKLARIVFQVGVFGFLALNAVSLCARIDGRLPIVMMASAAPVLLTVVIRAAVPTARERVASGSIAVESGLEAVGVAAASLWISLKRVMDRVVGAFRRESEPVPPSVIEPEKPHPAPPSPEFWSMVDDAFRQQKKEDP